jgi:hypothetical protein
MEIKSYIPRHTKITKAIQWDGTEECRKFILQSLPYKNVFTEQNFPLGPIIDNVMILDFHITSMQITINKGDYLILGDQYYPLYPWPKDKFEAEWLNTASV